MMKKLNQIGVVLLVLALVGCNLGKAQETGDSIVQITAEVNALEQLAPSDWMPGTYWEALPGASFAPLPCPPLDTTLPVYSMAIGEYLVDATGGQLPRGDTVSAMALESNAVVNLINQIQSTQAGQPMMRAMDDGSPLIPGGGDDGTNGYGSYTNSYSGYNFNTNLLWLEITNMSSSSETAWVSLFNGTNFVYSIWSTTNLALPFADWQVETLVFPTTSATNRLQFAVSTLGRQDLFLRAQDWTGVWTNGLPDWWMWYYFHTLDLDAADPDSQGTATLGEDYTNHNDPNIISFTIAVTNVDVNTATPILPLNVSSGVPADVAVLVNDTNTADAVWEAYNGSNAVATLGADGDYTVSVGLRGFPTNATATWQSVDLVKNTVLPRLTLITPTNSAVSQTPIQFEGFAAEALDALTFDVSNVNGTLTNQSAFLTGQIYNATLMTFTTNYFQSDYIDLAAGANIVTLHATDWAGNQTNVSFTLDYSIGTNPPVLSILWPPAGTVISGSTFTLQAQVNNPAVTINATIGATTMQGIVERNGAVWVQNLPLSAGTNSVTVTATDVNSNTASASINVVESGVGLDVYPLDQFNQSSVTVYGDISDPSLSVYVNGVLAYADYVYGTWEADNVTVNPTGTAILNVQVSNDVPALVASQTIFQAEPPTAVLMGYSGHQNFFSSSSLFSDYINWFNQTGGNLDGDLGDAVVLDAATNGAPYLPLYDPPYQNNIYNLPWEIAAISVLITNKFELYQNYSTARTMVTPTGQQQAGTTNTYLVLTRACEFSSTNIQDGGYGYGVPYIAAVEVNRNNINGNLPYGGDVGLPPEWLQVDGNTLLDTGMTNVESAGSGPSISSVWGAAIVSALAGEDAEITPTITHFYQNPDATYAQQVQALTLVITDTNGDNLTFQPNTVIVGQQMNLTCQLSATYPFMTNYVLTNIQWSVPGYAISNYVVAADGSSAVVVTNFPLNNSNVVFYWVDGASNRVVQCSAMVKGMPVKGQAVFNVVRPMAIITAVTGTADIYTNELGHPEAAFGNPNVMPGISLFSSVSLPPGTSYNFGNTNYSLEWVQIIELPYFTTVTTADSVTHSIEPTNTTLDTQYPYETGPITSDTPTTSFVAGELAVSLTQNSKMWLMFQPSNGEWVPLRTVTWNFNTIATNVGSLLIITNANWSTNPPDADAGTTYPVWTDNITNYDYSWHPPF